MFNRLPFIIIFLFIIYYFIYFIIAHIGYLTELHFVPIIQLHKGIYIFYIENFSIIYVCDI